MWLATLILLGISVVLALWGWDEKTQYEQVENSRSNKRN